MTSRGKMVILTPHANSAAAALRLATAMALLYAPRAMRQAVQTRHCPPTCDSQASRPLSLLRQFGLSGRDQQIENPR
jgi:hypothetical protein